MNKNRFLLLFLLCCALPLAAAKLVLTFGWFSAGHTSKGEWLAQEVFLLPDAHQQTAHWRITIVPLAEGCEQHCLNALYTVKQLYTGLGRKQQQVKPVLLESTVPADYPMFSSQALTTGADAVRGYIVLVDQQGLALLRYPFPETSKMAAVAADIRADLLKLLNYDRTSV